MKKILFMIGVVVASMQVTTAKAQAYMGLNTAEQDKMLFNHVSAGIGVGTDGLPSIEVAAPLTQYVSVRAGVGLMSWFKFDVKDIEVKNQKDSSKDEYTARLKMKKTDFKLLFDIHPFTTSSFRFTVGAYIGGKELISAENTSPVTDYANQYIKMGNHRIGFDSNGYTKITVDVNSFKPYLGIGFGRAVTSTPGLNFNFDLGVQFWGKPKVKAYEMDKKEMVEITSDDYDDSDFKDAMKIAGKIKVWPTLAFRLTYTFL